MRTGREKMQKKWKKLKNICSFKSNNICKQEVLRSFEHLRAIFDLFCLSVSPGGSRLTVHRRLQILGLGLGGVGGSQRECIICGRFFQFFCVIHTFKFSLTNFSHFVMLNCNGCCPWFICLCVLGGGKSGEPVAKKCKKEVKNFEKYFFFQKQWYQSVDPKQEFDLNAFIDF